MHIDFLDTLQYSIPLVNCWPWELTTVFQMSYLCEVKQSFSCNNITLTKKAHFFCYFSFHLEKAIWCHTPISILKCRWKEPWSLQKVRLTEWIANLFLDPQRNMAVPGGCCTPLWHCSHSWHHQHLWLSLE